MFWLFKRKKVADKKAITPCVCDNGDTVLDALNLQEFGGGRSTSDATISSRLSQADHRGQKGGYHRLQGDGGGEVTVLQPSTPTRRPLSSAQPPPATQEDPGTDPSSGSESSSDNERDYFDAFTDSDDEDEELTCNFCERSFHSVRRLEQHQQRKRHYMCSICDTVFDGLMLLEMHKEGLEHWSDYELRLLRRAAAAADDSEPDYSDPDDEPEEHRVYSSSRTRGDELRRLLL